MLIVLSQRIDTESDYSDELYKSYNFPAKYLNRIHENDVFVYYQGDRSIQKYRYYYGMGRVERIWSDDGSNYFASLTDCKRFKNIVPIYLETAKYIEQLGFEDFRKVPPWQSSIRPISEIAFNYILNKSGGLEHVKSIDDSIEDHLIEELSSYSFDNEELTVEYVPIPKEKTAAIDVKGHKVYPRDRKTSANALALAGFKCEVDPTHITFIRRNSYKAYTEPHHLVPMSASDSFAKSLDVEANIVSLCSNCHNLIHYGRDAIDLILLLYNARKAELHQAGIDITEEELLKLY